MKICMVRMIVAGFGLCLICSACVSERPKSSGDTNDVAWHAKSHKQMVGESLMKIREAHKHGDCYQCPFARKNDTRDDDWLATWVEPRVELSDEEKLAGEAILSEFGTKYMPNLYAKYEKVRDAAREIQQVFNEEFPRPQSIKENSAKWTSYNAVLERFADVRTDCFLYHDELCHFLIAHKLNIVSASELASIDSRQISVRLLPEDIWQMRVEQVKDNPVKNEVEEFANKYAPELYAHYCILKNDRIESIRNIEDLEKCMRSIDAVRFERAAANAKEKINELTRYKNHISSILGDMYMKHKLVVKTYDEIAKIDHSEAMRLQPTVNSLKTYVKDRTLGAAVLQADMIEIPGEGIRMCKTELTQLQWMVVMGELPPTEDRRDQSVSPCMPVDDLSWNECQQFIERLNKMTGLRFRLPTEDEWLCACGAGSGEGKESRSDRDRELRVHAVATQEANAWGLYDMQGNVAEWCDDGPTYSARWYKCGNYRDRDEARSKNIKIAGLRLCCPR